MAAPTTSRLTWKILIILTVIVTSSSRKGFSKEDLRYYRDRVQRMFQHAYNGYLRHAYPYDELRPLTCDGHDTWGSYSLTLVDALDTLAVMGNRTEFQRVAQLLSNTLDFDRDINVSVFETNIRVIGGLLSAHLMSKRGGLTLEPGWPCSGPLLRMAEDAARRLLPAFNTSTGMPYGTVNLRHGVPSGETTITCTAGVTTFIVEFGALSSLTGDPIFEKVAMRALKAMWNARSEISLVGNHIDVNTGKWTAVDSGIGAGVDSYFEYLVKGAILFQKSELMEMFHTYVSSIERYLKRDDWYLWSNMRKGTVSLPVFQSLEAFWPGMQSLVGDVDKAMKTIHNYHQVWKQYGFTPEFYNIPKSEAHNNREGYPLRPELIESTVYLYQATKDPYLLEIGIDILESIEHSAKTPCGYATIRDVRNHQLENRMESFFLAETTKYLYLLFDTESFIHNTGGKGSVINTPNGECIIDAGGYVFNTEAHPVDTAALYCCSHEKKTHDAIIQNFHDNVDLLSLLDLAEPRQDMFKSSRTKLKSKKIEKSRETPLEERVEKKRTEGPDKNSEIPHKENIMKGRVKVSIDKSAKHFEKQVKKLLEDVRISPESKDDIVDRIINTLHMAVKESQTESPQQKEGSSIEDGGGKMDDQSEDIQTESGTVDNSQGSGNDILDNQDDHSQELPKIPPNPIINTETVSERVVDEMTINNDEDIKDQPKDNQSNNMESDSDKLKGNEEDNDEGEAVCHPKDREFEELLGDVEEDEDGIKDDEIEARLLTCSAQPFYMRISLMGEMFVPRE